MITSGRANNGSPYPRPTRAGLDRTGREAISTTATTKNRPASAAATRKMITRTRAGVARARLPRHRRPAETITCSMITDAGLPYVDQTGVGRTQRDAQRKHRCRESRSTRWRRPVGLCHAVVGQWFLELRFSKICRGSSRVALHQHHREGGQKPMNHSLRDTGMPIVAVTTRGARSGKLRKNSVICGLPTAARMPSSPPRAARTNTAPPNPAATTS
jgi:hypothetical protein